MLTNIDIQGVIYSVPIWTNLLEKTWLISDDAESDIEDRVNLAVSILVSEQDESIQNNINKLSFHNKLFLLVVMRGFSYGPQLSNNIVCKHEVEDENGDIKTCGSNFVINFTIQDKIKYSNDDVNLSTMSVEEYSEYSKQLTFKLLHSFTCPSCGSVTELEYNKYDIFDSIVIGYDVDSMYNFYANMKYNFNFTIPEIDSMFVFERKIYEEKFNELLKQTNQNNQT